MIKKIVQVSLSIINFSKKIVTVSFEKFLVGVEHLILLISGKKLPVESEVLEYSRAPIRFGFFVIFIFVILGGGWAAFAPLASAAHARGIVLSQVDKQNVQCHTYGKVKHLFVKQGDIVKANQVILELEGTELKARYLAKMNAFLHSLASNNRLLSQRDDSEDVQFDNILSQRRSIPRIAKLLDIHRHVFFQNKKHKDILIDISRKNIMQHLERKKSFQKKKEFLQQKLNYTISQLDINTKLGAQGFAPKSEIERLKAEKIASESELKTCNSNIIECDVNVQKEDLDLTQKYSEMLTRVLYSLEENTKELSRVRDELVYAEEAFKNLYIRSPIDGTVNHIIKDSAVNSNNASFVADITPKDEDLVVEVKILSEDIDHVKVGQKTKVKFLSFKSRTSPAFTGTLVSISPNITRARENERPFYTGVIKMDNKTLDKFLKPRKLKLLNGMLADVQIVTGQRTLLRYLLDPILDQSFKALIEK